jgi:hypothetical protein
MQSIAILGKMSIKWPDRTREFFDIIAVVNFNTDMFRLECLFGHPEPIKTAILTAISPAVAFLLGVLSFPLVRMVAKALSKRAVHSAVEEMCKPVISHAPLQFQPVDVLAVASFRQYLCLLSVVKPPRSCHSASADLYGNAGSWHDSPGFGWVMHVRHALTVRHWQVVLKMCMAAFPTLYAAYF